MPLWPNSNWSSKTRGRDWIAEWIASQGHLSIEELPGCNRVTAYSAISSNTLLKQYKITHVALNSVFLCLADVLLFFCVWILKNTYIYLSKVKALSQPMLNICGLSLLETKPWKPSRLISCVHISCSTYCVEKDQYKQGRLGPRCVMYRSVLVILMVWWCPVVAASSLTSLLPGVRPGWFQRWKVGSSDFIGEKSAARSCIFPGDRADVEELMVLFGDIPTA